MALVIENNGSEILSSNFWDSETSNFFLSVNAGAARLLIPDSRIDEIGKMVTGKQVILSRGPCWPQADKDAIEIMFDDGLPVRPVQKLNVLAALSLPQPGRGQGKALVSILEVMKCRAHRHNPLVIVFCGY